MKHVGDWNGVPVMEAETDEEKAVMEKCGLVILSPDPDPAIAAVRMHIAMEGLEGVSLHTFTHKLVDPFAETGD